MRVRCSLTGAAAAVFCAGGGWSQTIDDFDAARTPSVIAQCANPPGPAPVLFPPARTGKFLRLATTPPVNSNTIAYALTNPGTFNEIVAEFDFRVTPQVGKADGVGFALLNTLFYGNSGPVCPTLAPIAPEEPNFAGSLGIGFDIHQETGEINNNHVSIHFNGIKLGEFDVIEAVNLGSRQWIHARITIRPGGGYSDVSVVLSQCGGPAFTVVNEFKVPGLVPYEGRVWLGARSSGDSAHHDVDNVRVQFWNVSPSILSFSTGCYEGVETGQSPLIQVTRSGPTGGTVTVSYTTSNGRAVAGDDFQFSTGILTFGPGVTTSSFSVPFLNDNLEEPNESFAVTLTNPTGGAVLGDSIASVAIVDDEAGRMQGFWHPPFHMRIVAVHMHQLPNGKVMIWPGDPNGPEDFTDPRIVDLSTGSFQTIPAPYKVYCGGHSFMADGNLHVAGGHVANNVGEAKAAMFNPFTNAWSMLPDMNAGRWYPTNTTLPNGDVLVTSGNIQPMMVNMIHQVWQTNNWTWRDLTCAPQKLPLYPFMFVAPDGRVFQAGPGRDTNYINTAGCGSIQQVGVSGLFRGAGSAVMYDPGKILLVGGASQFATDTAEIIDLAAPAPHWTLLPNRMAFARRHLNATLLPDGDVLVTGGTSGGFNDPIGTVLDAELWNPVTKIFKKQARMLIKRLYHSTAMLLPDGRVMVAGGGQPAPNQDVDNTDAQIFSPSYLFRGPRPVIAATPSVVSYGQPFTVSTPDAASVAKVNWVRLGSVTHSFDMNQRFNTLSFSPVAGGLTVTPPSSGNLAPPGHYMLFLINANGVPSVGAIVRIS